MTKFNEAEVAEIVEKINAEINEFQLNSKKHGVKAQARRARKNTLNLEKLFKEYRKASIK